MPTTYIPTPVSPAIRAHRRRQFWARAVAVAFGLALYGVLAALGYWAVTAARAMGL